MVDALAIVPKGEATGLVSVNAFGSVSGKFVLIGDRDSRREPS
jgi:hypothetical protein